MFKKEQGRDIPNGIVVALVIIALMLSAVSTWLLLTTPPAVKAQKMGGTTGVVTLNLINPFLENQTNKTPSQGLAQ